MTNPDAYSKEYAPKAQAVIKAAGGHRIRNWRHGRSNNRKVTVFDGEAPKRAVVQVWDSMEKGDFKRGELTRSLLSSAKLATSTRSSAPSLLRACRNNSTAPRGPPIEAAPVASEQ